MRVHCGYALTALALFLIEVAIALWVRDTIIRPFGGDVLAVILVYCGLRAITALRVVPAVLSAIMIGFVVEMAQAVSLVERLGLADDAVARTVLGTSFSVADLFAYMMGGGIALTIECLRQRG